MQVKRTDEQLDLMEWKMDNVEKQMVQPLDQDVCIVNLLRSVSEVRSLLLFYITVTLKTLKIESNSIKFPLQCQWAFVIRYIANIPSLI